MMFPKHDIRCDKTVFSSTIDVAIFEVSSEKQLVGGPLIFLPVSEGMNVIPTLRLKPDEAQQLMDELYRCGIRPSDDKGSISTADATEKHLKDMQTIAFKALDVILEGKK